MGSCVPQEPGCGRGPYLPGEGALARAQQLRAAGTPRPDTAEGVEQGHGQAATPAPGEEGQLCTELVDDLESLSLCSSPEAHGHRVWMGQFESGWEEEASSRKPECGCCTH